MIEFRLPSLGADMDEGKLLEWQVKPGDAVTKGQIVAIVDTAKAAIDVECWHDGTVQALLVEPGTTMPVGTLMAVLAEPGESAEQIEQQLAAMRAKQPAVAAKPAPAPPAKPAAPTSEAAPAAAATAAAAAAATRRAPPAAKERQRISPAARKRAAELGVDLARVRGSGPDRAVTLLDVEAAARAAKAAAPAAREEAAPIEKPAAEVTEAAPVAAEVTEAAPAVAKAAEVPAPTEAPAAPPAAERAAQRAQEMRKVIAAAMARSKREIPHYYLAEDVSLAHATAWLAAQNAERSVTERLLMAPLLLKTVALALRRFPELNGWYRNGAFEQGSGIHIGVAISLRAGGGLLNPALHDVDTKDIAQLNRELLDLIQRTRAGKLRSSELADGTITVTSLGDQGVAAVFGVIYPPQVALVGFGRVSERPWAVDGALRACPVVTASLAADHRVSDGHRGGLFLATVRELLQAPDELSEVNVEGPMA
jgi:pyruvate dehydrogenase E2 component (dihydrolipoamide acetyltransferase)